MQDLLNSQKISQLHRDLTSQLAMGEKLIWYAQPSGYQMKGVFAVWLFAIPWTLLPCYFIFLFVKEISRFGRISFDDILQISLPILFAVIGIFMILAPLLEIYSARYTIHGLTNRRLITLMKSKGQSLNSVDFDDMGPISFRQNSDGWGDLTVETGSYQNSKGRQIVQTFKFVGIPEVAKLERLLREAQEAR